MTSAQRVGAGKGEKKPSIAKKKKFFQLRRRRKGEFMAAIHAPYQK